MAFDDKPETPGYDNDDASFLLREGLDLLAAFRSIRSEATRKQLIILITSIAQAERDAAR